MLTLFMRDIILPILYPRLMQHHVAGTMIVCDSCRRFIAVSNDNWHFLALFSEKCRHWLVSFSLVVNGDAELSLPDWVWYCQWLTQDPACRCHQPTFPHTQYVSSDNSGDWNQLIADETGDRYHLVAALGHNSLALCCWWSRSILQHVHCAESCILYRFLLSNSLAISSSSPSS